MAIKVQQMSPDFDGSRRSAVSNALGILTAHKSLDAPRQRRLATRIASNVPRSWRFANVGPQAPMYQLNLITSGRVIDANVENLTILKKKNHKNKKTSGTAKPKLKPKGEPTIPERRQQADGSYDRMTSRRNRQLNIYGSGCWVLGKRVPVHWVRFQ